MIQKNVAVAFWLHHNNKILFHLRGEGCRDCHFTWDCGGGAMEPGETIEQALIREINEEYTLNPEDYIVQHQLPMAVFESDETGVWDIHLFVCEVVNPDQVSIGEPDKMTEFGWYALDELPEKLHPGVAHDMGVHMEKLKELVNKI